MASGELTPPSGPRVESESGALQRPETDNATVLGEGEPVTLPVLQNERYDLLDLLGSGGMATVYRARDRHTDRTVAVKILDERFSHRSEVLKRFELEAAAMEKGLSPVLAAAAVAIVAVVIVHVRCQL